MPAVSVVIPSYNHAKYLRTCLESVRRQTLADWEIVLVDDGSRDESVAVAEELAGNDPRIRVFRNDANLGTYGTQARGVELSSAPLIAILNSDDVWEPSKLEAQVELMRRHPDLPLSYTLGWALDDSSSGRRDLHAHWPREAVQETLPYLLEENRVLASSVLFRREAACFDASLRYSGDWVALLRAARARPLGCVAEPLTLWRQHETNSYTRSPAQVAEEIRVRRSILREPDLWRTPRVADGHVDRGLASCARHLAALCVLSGDMRGAREAAAIAVRFGGRSGMRRMAVCWLPPRLAQKALWGDAADGFHAARVTSDPVRWTA